MGNAEASLICDPHRFSPTCHLESDGQPTCDNCPPGFTGRRCERYAAPLSAFCCFPVSVRLPLRVVWTLLSVGVYMAARAGFHSEKSIFVCFTVVVMEWCQRRDANTCHTITYAPVMYCVHCFRSFWWIVMFLSMYRFAKCRVILAVAEGCVLVFGLLAFGGHFIFSRNSQKKHLYVLS